MSYPDVVELTEGDCRDCTCCTVCSNLCLCQEDLSCPSGMVSYLCAVSPVRLDDVRNYLQQKLMKEEKEEREFEEPSEKSSSSEDSSSSENSD